MEMQGSSNRQNNIEKEKVRGLTLPISKIKTKLYSSKECGTAIRIDTYCMILFNEVSRRTLKVPERKDKLSSKEHNTRDT